MRYILLHKYSKYTWRVQKNMQKNKTEHTQISSVIYFLFSIIYVVLVSTAALCEALRGLPDTQELATFCFVYFEI